MGIQAYLVTCEQIYPEDKVECVTKARDQLQLWIQNYPQWSEKKQTNITSVNPSFQIL